MKKLTLNIESTKKEYPDLPKKSLLFKINTQSDFRIIQSLEAYDNSVDTARHYEDPNRYDLLKYYDRSKFIDGHLNNLYNLRINRVLSLQYNFTINGKETQRLSNISKSSWIRTVIKYILESIFFGNSLIQIDVLNGSNVMVTLAPRQGVIPEFEMIKQNPMSSQGDYSYSNLIGRHLLDVNNNYDHRDLGLFRTLSRLALLKEQASLNWGEFIETYGQPLAAATTDSQNVNERNMMEEFLQNMGRRKYIVKDSQTEVEFINGTQNADQEMFREFIKFINDEMSEVVLSGNMITSDGSSRSQSEVHERGSLLLTKSDMQFVKTIINSQLIPLLQFKKILPKGNVEFNFDDIEVMSIDEKIKVDTFLIENYSKAPEYFKSRYGVEMDIENNTTEENG